MTRKVYVPFYLAFAIFFIGGLAFALDTVPGEYLVKYKGHPFFAVASMNAEPSLRVMDQHQPAQIVRVKVERQREAEVLARILKRSDIEYVVPNFKLRAFSAPYETSALREQWALNKVRAKEAWERAGNKGSSRVLVAVIDTGADYTHESLKNNMVAGYDFRDNDSDPNDQTSDRNPGHGTHCAGIIGATGLVDDGVVGISPEVAIMPIRFIGSDGSGDLNSAIKAIDYAIEKRASVISASWGATVQRSMAAPLIEAVKRADDAGVIFVAAAANDGRNNDVTEVFPANASFENTITVAASGPDDIKPQWSNYGRSSVHVASPGLNIMSTLPKNTYGNLSGTSMATPLVAGLVAFLKAQDETLSGAKARALMQVSGAKVDIETACHCRVDAFSAVDTLMSKAMYLTPSATTVALGESQTFKVQNGQGPISFSSTNEAVGQISAEGIFRATQEGETMIVAEDSNGQTAKTLAVYVGKKKSSGGGGGGDCPLGDAQLCQIICQIEPTLPWCD